MLAFKLITSKLSSTSACSNNYRIYSGSNAGNFYLHTEKHTGKVGRKGEIH